VPRRHPWSMLRFLFQIKVTRSTLGARPFCPPPRPSSRTRSPTPFSSRTPECAPLTTPTAFRFPSFSQGERLLTSEPSRRQHPLVRRPSAAPLVLLFSPSVPRPARPRRTSFSWRHRRLLSIFLNQPTLSFPSSFHSVEYRSFEICLSSNPLRCGTRLRGAHAASPAAFWD